MDDFGLPIAPAGSAMKKAAIKKALVRRAVVKKAVKKALLKRAVKKRAVKRAVAKRAVKKRAVKRMAKRAVKKRAVKRAVRRRVAGKAVRKRAVKRAVRRRVAGRRSGRGSRARRQPGWCERSCVRAAERPREHVFPVRDLVRSHEAGLAFAGAPSRPVVINRSPPFARIVKWGGAAGGGVRAGREHRRHERRCCTPTRPCRSTGKPHTACSC